MTKLKNENKKIYKTTGNLESADAKRVDFFF